MTPEQFMARVLPEPNSGCWIWLGAVADKRGYGLVHKNGANSPRTGAHRYSYELHYGQIADGMVICHRCDNPSCVNPDHLFVGTISDNAQDSIKKGRGVHGKYQKLKTNCPKGHPYEGKNLILYDGRRYCRTCMAFYAKRWREKRAS